MDLKQIETEFNQLVHRLGSLILTRDQYEDEIVKVKELIRAKQKEFVNAKALEDAKAEALAVAKEKLKEDSKEAI